MKSLSTFFNLLVLLLLTAAPLKAQVKAENEPADIDTELNTPTVPNKHAGVLRRVMTAKAQTLIDEGYNVELMRDDQVIAVTIQLDKLFKPNEVELLETANKLLKPFTDFTRHYGKYKLLLAVHSDDTGSQGYRSWLCEHRIVSLYDFFDSHGSTPAMVYGYPLGHEQPIADDNSRANRALNRRLEIFIVPGPELISNLKNRK